MVMMIGVVLYSSICIGHGIPGFLADKTTGETRDKDAIWKAQLAQLIWSWDKDGMITAVFSS